MSIITKLDIWSEKNQSFWIDALRIVLGMAIFAKAVLYLADSTKLVTVLNENFGINRPILAKLIAVTQLAAGVLITCGFATRLACIAQLPFICLALVASYLQTDAPIVEFIYSTAAILGLVFFLVRGSGKFSVHYLVFI